MAMEPNTVAPKSWPRIDEKNNEDADHHSHVAAKCKAIKGVDKEVTKLALPSHISNEERNNQVNVVGNLSEFVPLSMLAVIACI